MHGEYLNNFHCAPFRMLMPKKNRIAIYEHLFKEGVMVAKKDFHATKHPEVEAVPNLHVIKALQVSTISMSFLYVSFESLLLETLW